MKKLSLSLQPGDRTQFMTPNGERVQGEVEAVDGPSLTMRDESGKIHLLTSTDRGWETRNAG